MNFRYYADDTVLFTNCNSVDRAQKLMQASLVALEQWCKRNAIFVNVKKTKYMLCGSRVALAKYRDKEIMLKIDKQAISRVHSYCYLGVTLDEQLNYETHAQGIFGRVKHKLYQLRAMRYFLNKQAMLLIYKNMVLPILEYGDIFLSSLSKQTRKAMQVLRNKALKIALNHRKRDSVENVHKEANLAKLDIRRKIHTLQFAFGEKNTTTCLFITPLVELQNRA